MKKLSLLFVAAAMPLLLNGGSQSLAAGTDGSGLFVSMPAERGWLGVSIQDMTPRLARSMDVKTEEGALVSDVIEDSPAGKAGIKDEDIIVEFDGKKIADAQDLTSAVRKTKPGTEVTVAVVHNDKKNSLKVTIGELPEKYADLPSPPPGAETYIFESLTNPRVLGLRLHTLNKQLGTYFQAPDGHGVLVEEVEEGSAGSKAGLKAGDVIIRVGKKSVEKVSDIRKALQAYDKGEKADIEVMRNGAKTTLSAVVEDTDHSSGRSFRYQPWPHGGRFREFRFEMPDDIRLELPDLGPDMKDLQRKLQDLKNRIRIQIRRHGDHTAVDS